MNKLKTMLCAACTLVLFSVSNVAYSDSGNFAGPYVGFSLLGVGAEMDGTSTSTGGQSTSVKDDVSVGQTAAATGWEAGYALPIGSSLLLDIGASYLTGEAKYRAKSTDDTGDDHSGVHSGDVSFSIDKHFTYYIAPTIVLSDTSSLYIKAAVSEADVGVTGDITTPGDLQGETWAVGTRTVLDNGVFIRTEAGYTRYNGISAHGKGEGADGAQRIATDTSYSAEPTIVHGTFSIGLRF